MRLNKLIEIDEFLKEKCALLIKGPPGSGKSTMADLFEFYLKLKDPLAICYRINVNKNIKTDKDLFDLFKTETDIFLQNFNLKPINQYKPKIYAIVDECHEIYGDKQKQPFENFWKVIKQIVEGPYQVHLKFLFCAVYSDTRIQGESFCRSPLVLKDRLKGLDFLKFTQNEFNEILNYYSNSALSQTFPITDDQIRYLIWKESNGFPQLTMKTITFLRDNLNNSPDKSYKITHEAIFSKKFRSDVINTLKAFAVDIIKNLNYNEQLFLRDLHIQHKIYVHPQDMNGKYDLAKYLESYGIIVEDSSNFFSFPADSLSSAYFNFICNDLSQTKMTKVELLKMDKVELVVTAIQRMKFDNLIKVSKTKAEKTDDGHPSEDQWILEFYNALRSMIPEEHEIHSQCNKVINDKFIGEL